MEMQSQVKDPNRPAKMTIGNVAKYIYSKNGLIGFYRGVTPRIGLGVWQTVGFFELDSRENLELTWTCRTDLHGVLCGYHQSVSRNPMIDNLIEHAMTFDS